jgi:hypothetical protein
MTIAERRRPKVEEMASAQLLPGEQIESTLSFGQTGPSPWLAALTYFIFFMVKMKAVVVTNQRVILITKSFWTGRPQAVEATFPRSACRVLAYRSPTLWGKLVLQLGETKLTLNVPRIHGAEADALVTVLGGVSIPAQ